MKKLLIFVDWFLPGFKAGGQIQSCANLALELKDELDIYVVTTDRDMGDNEPYENIATDQWTQLRNGLQVIYLSPGKRGFKSIQSVIREIRPHCIYLNSMFSFSFTLLPIEVCKYDNMQVKIILAPRGMLHKGALQYKNFKKKVFFHAFKVRGFQKRISFHATDPTEVIDIKKIFGSKVRIALVGDFPGSEQPALTTIDKQKGRLSCLFVSRISPKKNLSYLLLQLQHIKSAVKLSIAGPLENKEYWQECSKLLAFLPANVETAYIGSIPNLELASIYRQHHLFVLPTHGENFGHVIFDALLNGRPVLISDHTPWKNLEEKSIGWDIPLVNEKKFVEVLENAAGWDQAQFDAHCQASWHFASSYLHSANLKNEYLRLFE